MLPLIRAHSPLHSSPPAFFRASADLETQAAELHAKVARQAGELAEAVEAAKGREAEAAAQLRAAEAKLREAVQRDER